MNFFIGIIVGVMVGMFYMALMSACSYADGYENGVNNTKKHLSHAPNMEIVEATHGQWIKDGESIYCSACGFETSSLLPYVCDGEKWVPGYANKYCGNCGAKMDGGKNDKL